ncbi:hypothetical protein E2562_009191, partial [Oryza meyeriana var. granulata]
VTAKTGTRRWQTTCGRPAEGNGDGGSSAGMTAVDGIEQSYGDAVRALIVE